jgi:uncharacterized protein DUF5808
MSTPRRIRSLARTIAVGLVVAAVVQELAKPSDERTWTGHVLGFVPYDFRRPTWRRVREAYWNPDDPRLFTDRVLGVGWAINLHRAGVLLSSLFSRLGAETERTISLRHWDGG